MNYVTVWYNSDIWNITLQLMPLPRKDRAIISFRRRKESTMNYSFSMPSILILIVVMGYYFLRPRLPIRLNRAFLALLVIQIGTEVTDLAASYLDDHYEAFPPWALWLFNLLYFVFYLCRIYMFFVFIRSVLDSRGVSRSGVDAWAFIVLALSMAVALLSPLTGWLFRIDGAGYHAGPLYHVLYVCSGACLLFSLCIILPCRKQLTRFDFISLLSIIAVLLAGNVIRFLFPRVIIMSLFSFIAILIIFISFLDPDHFLSERGHVFNLPAFQALLSECYRRRRPCRVLSFVLRNYTEHREIFGGKQMDEALERINRWLVSTCRGLSVFYLHNGVFAVVGLNHPDLNRLSDVLRRRFADPWSTSVGPLRLSIAFVEADTDAQHVPADKLINALMITLDDLGHAQDPKESRSLSDSIEEINRRLEIRRLLEKALEEDGLEVFYQPLVESESRRRVAAEALVRLRDDGGSLIPPDRFIALAERDGYIARLGEQVLAKVCVFLRDHDPEALGLQWINVNLSPVQLMHRDLPRRFMDILNRYQVSPSRIHLEITEQSMIDFALLRSQIDELHACGFLFALDDYGSGYSNLTRVRQYPFFNIKFDMEVIRNYCAERDPLLPGLIRSFREMGLSATAEGIETADMAALMQQLGCDYLQGYYFSRPVPPEEFIRQPRQF